MITQNDLQLLKAEVQADTDDGGGLPTSNVVADGVSNNLFPDVSDLDRQIGRVRLRKIFMGVQTANRDLLQAARLIFTELPANPNISVFAFKATSFADRRRDAQNTIESYLAFGTKWAGHLLETQLKGQRVIQISLDKGDPIPAVNQPLVLVQNEGASDEFYQYIRPLKVETTERRFQKNASETVTRTVATIEFGDPLRYTFAGLSVPEFYQNTSTSRRAILREARVADAAKYYSAAKLAEPITAMTTNQARLTSIYTQVVPSTQVETPLLQRDPVNNISAQARGQTQIAINQSVNIAPNTSLNLAGGIAIGSLNLTILGAEYIDRKGELVGKLSNTAIASVDYSVGTIKWYSVNYGQTNITGNYKPASSFIRVAQTDYQIVGENAGYNYTRELGAVPIAGSLRISYVVQGNTLIVTDDGRGNLIDEGGNGRGTILDKSVLLTTAAIPDVGSAIVYAFGVDLDTQKYGQQTLKPAYHSVTIPDVVVGDIAITWGDKTATASGGVITGDATGVVVSNELHIAPNVLPAKNTEFTLSYQKRIEADTITGGGYENVIPEGNNGIFETALGIAKTISDAKITVDLRTLAGVALRVILGIDSSGTKLRVDSVLKPNFATPPLGGGGVVSETPESWTVIPDSLDYQQWKVQLLNSSVNKTGVTGGISFKIKVTRQSTGIDVIARPGVSPIFKTVFKDAPMRITAASVNMVGQTGVSVTAATASKAVDALYIELPQDSAEKVVNGSLIAKIFGNTVKDKDGALLSGANTIGAIEYKSGGIKVTTWTTGATNTAELISMLRENDPVPLANIVFRTPMAPIKKESLQITCKLADGTSLTLGTDAQGNITGSKYAHGTVDFKSGVVMLYFYEQLGVTANPDVVYEPWYDAANIYMVGSTNYINKPYYVQPDSIRYNAVSYSYLPLDKELIGLDPVRLPTDGRVPFVRKGDSVAITEAKTMQLATNAVGDSFDLGFERLSDVSVVDSTGKRVTNEQIDVDLDAGTIVLNGLFDVSQYTPPLTAKYRIMDMGLVIETDISGKVTLSTPITHDYTTDAILSSMLIAGDMQARAYNVFSQKTWGGVWSDNLIGESAVIQLQTANNPIVVTNKDAITEQWALVFTNTTEFKIIGRTLGQIGGGSTSTRTAPINPQTGQPYFVIEVAAWGGGGAAGNAIRLNTQAAAYPVWLGNAIGQHVGSSKDNYDFTIGYHANIDRKRGE